MNNDDDLRVLALQAVLATLIHEIDKAGNLGIQKGEVLNRSKALVRACTKPRMNLGAADKAISGINEALHQIR